MIQNSVIEKLDLLVRDERGSLVDFLQSLLVVKNERLHLSLGYGSLFDLLTRRYGFSESCAQKRSQVLGAVEKFPELLEELREGRLHLTAVSMLCPYLTPENKDQVIQAARGKSKRDLEWYLVSLMKPVDLKEPKVEQQPAQSATPRADLFSTPPAPEPAKTVCAQTKIKPISESQALLQFQASRALVEKIERLEALLGVNPAKLGELVERAIDTLLEKVDPVKIEERAAARKEKNNVTTPAIENKRTPPAALRRQVLKRDNFQCCYVNKNGTRCVQKKYLEIDHIRPWAMGGKTDLQNLRVLCSSHNKFKGSIDFAKANVPRRTTVAREITS